MILFRADANPNIGMGHIMRCLSIADAARSVLSSCEIVFLLADGPAAELVENRGYRAIVLNSDYQDMEAELRLWPEIYPEILIVDSYFATALYLSELSSRTNCLVYMDDLGTFPYPVDILVNYNAYGPYMDYAALYAGSNAEMPELILGPAYAPLRAMFRGVERKKQPETVRNVLISTGGADELHIARQLVQRVAEKRDGTGKVTYHFLLGAMNRDKKEIRQRSEGQKNIVLHENVTDMKSLISSADLVVSSAGSTLYEICACGSPLITYALADNQLPGAEAFAKLDLAVNLGDLRRDGSYTDGPATGELRPDAVDRILSSVDQLGNDYERRLETGRRMQEMIDGFGADRMVDKILSLSARA